MRLEPMPGLRVVLLAAMVLLAMPAIARADSDERKVINGAKVRVKVVGHKTFIANKGPGPLILKYPDGTTMATVPAGAALMLEGFTPGLSANGTLGARTDDRFFISISPQSRNVQIRLPDDRTITAKTGGYTLRIYTPIREDREDEIRVKILHSEDAMTRYDRAELSAIGGN